MKVLLINGSPNKEGCTYTALKEIALTLESNGIEAEIYHIGKDPIAPCRACRACAKIGKCVINDKVNEFVEYARDFDGYIIGSPVHYGSAAGSIVPFLDRAFFVDFMSGHDSFKFKPGSAIVSARRAGTTATIDQLNKYFQINQMPVISGRYWNMVHGQNPDEVKQDKEGMQNMRILARNFAYFLKCKDLATKAGLKTPKAEEVEYTNFIH
ncbi:MAG: NADPH-dependent FMN reductase [Candidatus Melainabacteria bacterium 35_41]|nr:MAG: NADPH-dependent FMN reductase [Candidatus Melainabacteria bacterium 35_41]